MNDEGFQFQDEVSHLVAGLKKFLPLADRLLSKLFTVLAVIDRTDWWVER